MNLIAAGVVAVCLLALLYRWRQAAKDEERAAILEATAARRREARRLQGLVRKRRKLRRW